MEIELESQDTNVKSRSQDGRADEVESSIDLEYNTIEPSLSKERTRCLVKEGDRILG